MSEHGDFRYAWRDGFLLLSDSAESLRAALDADARPHSEVGPAEIELTWRGFPAGQIRFTTGEGWPLRGHLDLPIQGHGEPLALPEAWPEQPLLALTAHRWEDAAAMINAALRISVPWIDVAPLAALARDVWRTWALPPLPDQWDRAMAECAIAVLDVDTSETLPIPELAFALRTGSPGVRVHPLEAWIDRKIAFPGVWNGHAGTTMPILGEKVALCLAGAGSEWLSASRESVMAQLAGRLKARGTVPADVVVEIDWGKAGTVLRALLNDIARLGLAAGLDAREAAAQFEPYARAMMGLGRLEIAGVSEQGRLAFSGTLAQGGAK